jgi:hypothetical protein
VKRLGTARSALRAALDLLRGLLGFPLPARPGRDFAATLDERHRGARCC